MTRWIALTLLSVVVAGCNGSSTDSLDRRGCGRHRCPGVDASVDSSTSKPDAAKPDAAAPQPDAAAPQPDAAAPKPDAAMQPDASLPDASTGGGGGTGPTYPTQHPKIYINANRARLANALATGRTAATRFKTLVDNYVAGTQYYAFPAWNVALMGQLSTDPKYCAKAVSDIDAQVSAAETAIAAGTAPAVAGDSYLQVGPMIGDLALVYDWCYSAVTASQRTRWLAYADQAVYNVWHPSQATWGGKAMTWSGWATNDPSDNYYYSFLRATMMLGLASYGEDSQAATWLTEFHDTKVLGELVPTFNSDLVGGCSREGTGYGTAMMNLWVLYDFWKATTGEDLASKTGHTRASMVTFMHQVVPTLDRFAPTGDQSRDSTASMFDYQRNYLQELAQLYASDPVAPSAQTLLAQSSVPVMQNAFTAWGDFLYDFTGTGQPLSNLNTTHYAPGIGELYMRSGWDTHATWVNLIAGPYTQSHAHQDQGSLMIYKDGWLAYDAIIPSHSGIRQETTMHGEVRIDSAGSPVTQVGNTISHLVALHTGSGWVYAASDVTPAFNGKSAVTKDQREVVYLKPDVVIVYDRVTSAAGTSQVWQLPAPVQPAVSGANATITSSTHTLHVQRLAPATATSTVYNYTVDSDFSSGFRLDETSAGGDLRHLHVLSVDNAVTSATASGDSTVTVVLANGTTVKVAFNHDAIGATLTYGSTTTTLAAGLDTLAD